LDNSGVQVDVAETNKEVKVSRNCQEWTRRTSTSDVSDGMLVISGEKKADREVDEKWLYLHERSFGRVERIAPADGIDANAAQANFRAAS